VALLLKEAGKDVRYSVVGCQPYHGRAAKV
jgi:hypothetical protein